MRTTTLTLTDFLLTRIAEDEAEARAFVGMLPNVIAGTRRRLAECEARRCIAHLHEPKYPEVDDCKSCADGWEDQTGGESGYTPEVYPCLTARNLALPYADHPDYRDEWRP